MNKVIMNSYIPPNIPHSFTGKERDSETGFSYFGARYYDSDLMTGWLSVDPMADKYPSLSPYAYCANNPVKLVDPDGEDPDIFMFSLEDNKLSIFNKASKFIQQRNNAFQIMAHGNHLWMREVRNGKITEGNNGKIDSAKKFDEVFKDNQKWNEGKYQKGFELILYSCNTGRGEKSLASKISKEYSDITVIAPTRQIQFSEKGISGVYSEDKKGNKDFGYWIVFQNGKAVEAYDSSWIPGTSSNGHKINLKEIPKGHIDGIDIGEKEYKK